MIYPNNFESKIGFDKIRTLLLANCLSPLGKEKVEKMTFLTDYDKIALQLALTDEFLKILSIGDFPDQNFFDVRLSLRRLRIEGTYCDLQELFDIRRSLDASAQIVTYLQKSEEEDVVDNPTFLYPNLQALTQGVETFPMVVRQIDRILDPLGNMRDTASPELLRIRREKQAAAARISRLLNSILHSAQSDGVVEKNITPTLRDGRLVIPVAPAMKRKISGIVHDESDSGRTVYIEPTQVVEANNHVNELENEERREIIRILREISALLRPHIPEMLRNYELLADIDFVQAKARLAQTTRSVRPQFVDRQQMDWSLAVHPLLELSLQRKTQGEAHVVPLDITLRAPHQRIILISGPNAGGKSVCLKTVGLLQYMLQCGLLIPVAPSSVCGIFSSIFIDIGDEQNIENDLSTYSSHLLNMKMMMRHADGKSLLLIDEFGGGTEPQIGGAMAEAMLRRFNRRHNFGVITTHYQNLKHFAGETDGVVNGAMLYDRQQMRPLFQLSIGNPGSSFAVEIARKIGIPEDVIKEASEIVGKDYINSDKYLQDIVRDKKYWENKRDAIHRHEKRMEETIARYESDIEKINNERKEIISRAKDEAKRLLDESNARIEQTVRSIKEAQAERERTKQIRQTLAEFKQQVKDIDTEAADEKIRRQMERIKARQQRKADKKSQKAEQTDVKAAATAAVPAVAKTATGAALREGDYVKLKGQSVIGQIVRIAGQNATVTFGALQTNVKLNRLIPSDPPPKTKRADTFVSRETQDDIRETALNFRSELNVIGMRTDEAIQAVTYFIDDALVASCSRVRITHGTGAGILKTMIRQYLKTVPAVATFYDEDVRFGGAGVTIVELV